MHLIFRVTRLGLVDEAMDFLQHIISPFLLESVAFLGSLDYGRFQSLHALDCSNLGKTLGDGNECTEEPSTARPRDVHEVSCSGLWISTGGEC